MNISIVIPAFNEYENIMPMYMALNDVFADMRYEYEIIFVDDGSSDDTINIIKKLSDKHKNIFYIEFSRNFGHQAALKAGLDFAKGDCVISMDCDMQHPPALIPEMIKKWEEGFDIVYTRRKEDLKLSFFKRKTSSAFYWITNKLSDVKIEDGTADFRLMDRKTVDIFSGFTENDIFARGMIKWMGFKQFGIDYSPGERLNGETKYTINKMVALAIKGITSFSTAPLHAAIYIGFILSSISLLYFPYVLYSYFTNHASSGWASVLLTIVFFGGIQMILIGILGIYVGKLFMQSKNRPNYIIRTTNLK